MERLFVFLLFCFVVLGVYTIFFDEDDVKVETGVAMQPAAQPASQIQKPRQCSERECSGFIQALKKEMILLESSIEYLKRSNSSYEEKVDRFETKYEKSEYITVLLSHVLSLDDQVFSQPTAQSKKYKANLRNVRQCLQQGDLGFVWLDETDESKSKYWEQEFDKEEMENSILRLLGANDYPIDVNIRDFCVSHEVDYLLLALIKLVAINKNATNSDESLKAPRACLDRLNKRDSYKLKLMKNAPLFKECVANKAFTMLKRAINCFGEEGTAKLINKFCEGGEHYEFH